MVPSSDGHGQHRNAISATISRFLSTQTMDFAVLDDAAATAADDATVSDADLATCVRVLTALGADNGEFHSPRCKALRVAMQPFLVE